MNNNNIEDLYLSLYNTRSSLHTVDIKPKDFVALNNALTTCLNILGDDVSRQMKGEIKNLFIQKELTPTKKAAIFQE